MRYLIFGLVFAYAFAASHAAVIYVPDDCPTIQDAIDNSSNGDTIIVKAGTYFENIDFIGKAIHLKSESGPGDTTIGGNQGGSVVTFQSGEGADSLIEGFTICDGTGTLKTSNNNYYGGGIRCDLSSPTIVGNVIEKNSVMGGNWGGSGGGVYCWDSSAVIMGNTIRGNWAFSGGAVGCALGTPRILVNVIEDNFSFYGGGMSIGSNSAVIERNVVTGNSADYCGGGIRCNNYGSPMIKFNWIYNNWAHSGGGISCECYSSPSIINNIFYKNIGEWDGGALTCIVFAEPTVTNNIIVKNETYGLYGRGGGGIFVTWGSEVVVRNTILYDNISPNGPEIYLDNHNGPSQVDIEYCDVEGGQSLVFVESGCTLNWGPGMIDDDPLFVDSDSDDYHLTWGSPCLNVGDNAAVNDPNDFEGDPRIAFGTVDMGADEYYYHLYHMGDVVPGSPIQIKVVGYPTAPVTSYLGSGLADPPYSTQHGDFYLNWPPLWQGQIGTVPGNGVKVFSTTVPSNWNPGSEHYLQALVGPWGGAYSKLTNLDTLEVE